MLKKANATDPMLGDAQLYYCDVHEGFVPEFRLDSNECPYCQNKEMMNKHAAWHSSVKNKRTAA